MANINTVADMRGKVLLTLAASSALLAPVNALAQRAAATSGTATAADIASQDGSDIVVTATRRSERLTDVPLAITAITGDGLAKKELRDFRDFSRQVPGLNIQEFAGNFNRVIIRGQNSGGAVATTATVVDDVPFTAAGAIGDTGLLTPNIDTYDLARVEVLRGPQGTLYGATALGGLIKYVTNVPDLTRVQGGADVGFEAVGGGGTAPQARGFVNVPLASDVAALRVTGYYQGRPGYIDNNLRGARNANSAANIGGRAQLLVKPTDTLSLRLQAFYQDYTADAGPRVAVVGSPAAPLVTPANAFQPLAGLNFDARYPNSSKSKSQIYSGEIVWDASIANITSLTSYAKYDSSFQEDATGLLAAPGLTFGTALGGAYGQPGGIALRQNQIESLEKFTQEVRIASKPQSAISGLRLDWQLGGFYTNEKTIFDQNFNPYTLTGTALAPTVTGSFIDGRYREFAVFGETTLYFGKLFDISLGGRWADNKQSAVTTNPATLFTGPVAVSSPSAPSAESVFTYSVAPRLHLGRDTLVYGRIASGYRPGGPNPAFGVLPANLRSFASSTTTNYELGLRTALIDRKVTIDVAVFQIDWKNIQVLTTYVDPVTSAPSSVNTNGASARSKGVEWNFGLTPVKGLHFGILGAYTDATFTSPIPSNGSNAGDQLPYVPKWTNTANADYEFPAFSDYSASFGASWSYVGRRNTDPTARTDITSSRVNLPSYNLIDLRAGLNNASYSVQLYIRNLFDERGVLGYANAAGPTATYGSAVFVQPRTFGIRAGYKF